MNTSYRLTRTHDGVMRLLILGAVKKQRSIAMGYNPQRRWLSAGICGALVFILMACAGGVVYETTEQVSQDTKIRTDPYTNTTWVSSPPVNFEGGSIGDKCWFRTSFIDGRFGFYQLVVTVESREWLFLESARDIQGNRLDVKVLDRKVLYGGKRVQEDIAISLSDSYMAQAAVNGINIRVSGQRGSTIVKLPNGYVFGYLQRVGTYMQEVGMLPTSTQEIMIESMKAQQAELASKLQDRGKIGISVAFKQVLTISAGSPAEAVGLMVGDLILTADGQPLNGDMVHDGMLLTGTPGSSVKLEVLRGDERRAFTITRGEP